MPRAGLRGQGSRSRTLGILELYCGRAAIARAAVDKRLSAVGIDRDESSNATVSADLCTMSGTWGRAAFVFPRLRISKQ